MGAKCCAAEEAAVQAELNSGPVTSQIKEEEVKDVQAPIVQAVPAVPAAVPPAKDPPKVGEEFTVQIVKGGPERSKLGIDADLTDGIALVIDSVNDGLIRDWNIANPEMAINRFDRIVEVNGQRGNANDITEVCKNDNTLIIKVLKMKQ
eukprot:TRINITY_DN263_c2_g1_i1.p1 TRINITY_DN263_c2_g1~~TRINITY_DN263_c2_g1_i1.p1  ORF type:complete len:149 (-),score=38.73 TRINITY_DN263_c2_g1_i1:113-559(-)